MKRLLTFLVALNLFSLLMYGAEPMAVSRIEGEFRIGGTVPLGGWMGGRSMLGAALGLELRYNIPDSPWDMGFLCDVTTAVRKIDSGSIGCDQSNRSAIVALMGDYNFAQGYRVNPFLGAGLGYNSYDTINEVVYYKTGSCPAFILRGGVELFHHLRFSLSANITHSGFSNLELAVGGVIGGRPKK